MFKDIRTDSVWSGKLHVALPKRPINQFKPVQQSKKQALRAYCPNIYTLLKDGKVGLSEEFSLG